MLFWYHPYMGSTSILPIDYNNSYIYITVPPQARYLGYHHPT